jgi:hypothetical protein
LSRGIFAFFEFFSFWVCDCLRRAKIE